MSIETRIGLDANPFKRGLDRANAALKDFSGKAKQQSKDLEDQFKTIQIFRAGAAAFGISMVKSFFDYAINRANELGTAVDANGAAVQRFGKAMTDMKGMFGDVAVAGVGFLNRIGEGLGSLATSALRGLGFDFASDEEVERVRARQQQLDNFQKLRDSQRAQEAKARAEKERADAEKRKEIERQRAEMERAAALAAEEAARKAKEAAEDAAKLAEQQARAAKEYAEAQAKARDAIKEAAKAQQEQIAGMADLTPQEQKDIQRAEKEAKREADRERRRLDRQRREDEAREKELAGMSPRDEMARRKIQEREERMRRGLERPNGRPSALETAAERLTRLRERSQSITDQLGQNTGLKAPARVMAEQLTELQKIRANLEPTATNAPKK